MKAAKFVVIVAFTLALSQYVAMTANVEHLYALVALPGTFFHELAHYITALFLGGSPHNFNLIPSGNLLGSVNFFPNWYNAATVSLAPLLLMPLTFLLTAIASATKNVFKILLFSYFAACSWLASVPSPQDFSIAMVPTSWPLATILLGAATYLMYKVTRRLILL